MSIFDSIISGLSSALGSGGNQNQVQSKPAYSFSYDSNWSPNITLDQWHGNNQRFYNMDKNGPQFKPSEDYVNSLDFLDKLYYNDRNAILDDRDWTTGVYFPYGSDSNTKKYYYPGKQEPYTNTEFTELEKKAKEGKLDYSDKQEIDKNFVNTYVSNEIENRLQNSNKNVNKKLQQKLYNNAEAKNAMKDAIDYATGLGTVNAMLANPYIPEEHPDYNGNVVPYKDYQDYLERNNASNLMNMRLQPLDDLLLNTYRTFPNEMQNMLLEKLLADKKPDSSRTEKRDNVK